MAQSPSVSRFKDVIMHAGLVDEYQMRAALARLEQWGGRLPTVIVEMGFCTDAAMTAALSRAFRVPHQPLAKVVPDKGLLAKLPAAYCEERGVFPLGYHQRMAVVAMVEPTALDTIDDVATRVGAHVHPVLASEFEIRSAVAKHYYGHSDTPVSRVNGFDPSLANAGLTLVDIPEALDDTLSEHDWARLRALRDTQDKTALILKTIQALMREKIPLL